MQKHFENSEFELKNKINLLEKQLRIRRAQLSQIKEESRTRLKLEFFARSDIEKRFINNMFNP